MAHPVRIHRSRGRGHKLPPNTICVTRPSRWSNPYRITQTKNGQWWVDGEIPNQVIWGPFPAKAVATSLAVALFLYSVRHKHHEIRNDLAGFNLACWCAADEECHADALLGIANT